VIVRSATIPMPGDRLRLAVVSDTHSEPHPRIAEHLAHLAPDALLHGGDIGDLRVLEDLAATGIPLYAVRGNIDVRARDIADIQLLDIERPKSPIRILLTHIAIYGAKLRTEVIKRAKAERAHLVVCGHSHVPFIGLDRGIAMFNPGSIGPRRFQLPISFGTIDITPTNVSMAHWNCETGEPWSPP
jgi:putative phosphoesterase